MSGLLDGLLEASRKEMAEAEATIRAYAPLLDAYIEVLESLPETKGRAVLIATVRALQERNRKALAQIQGSRGGAA